MRVQLVIRNDAAHSVSMQHRHDYRGSVCMTMRTPAGGRRRCHAGRSPPGAEAPGRAARSSQPGSAQRARPPLPRGRQPAPSQSAIAAAGQDHATSAATAGAAISLANHHIVTIRPISRPIQLPPAHGSQGEPDRPAAHNLRRPPWTAQSLLTTSPVGFEHNSAPVIVKQRPPPIGRVLAYLQPVAQTPVKGPAPQDLGLLNSKGGKYRGQVGLLAVCATG